MRANLPLAVLAASVTTNVVLGIQAWRRPGRIPTASGSMIGKAAPDIFGHRISRPRSRLTAFVRPSVVDVISPGCGWCARNTASITTLWQRPARDHDFVGLSLMESGLQEYLSQNPPPFVVAVAEPETIAEYGVGVTPSTLLISLDRLVLEKWNGARDGDACEGVQDERGGVRLLVNSGRWR